MIKDSYLFFNVESIKGKLKGNRLKQVVLIELKLNVFFTF